MIDSYRPGRFPPGKALSVLPEVEERAAAVARKARGTAVVPVVIVRNLFLL